MLKKAITFSFDDGVTQDKKLVEIFNKYNLKGTFNLNSEYLGKKVGAAKQLETNASQEIKSIYFGHEIAAHTLGHTFLPDLEEKEIIREVEQDRLNLSDIVGYEVVGMAYPCSGQNNDDRTAKIIKENTGIKYARALESNHDFKKQDNLFRFKSTCYHMDWDIMLDLAERFLDLKPQEESVFYIWGHSYEFDYSPGNWQRFEEFCKIISGHKDIFYGTNKEVLLNSVWR